MKLGEKQKLEVVKQTGFGIYLAKDADSNERVLLPAKQAPKDVQIGDVLEVFLYRDSQDRLIATVREPLLSLGGIAALEVVSVGKIGAFLNWGLEKDLLLPYKQMTREVCQGETILVTLYIDKSSRLCASMKNLYDCLSTDSPYEKDDSVSGRIYEFSGNFGTFVAVDDRYSAMIPDFEDCTGFKIGDVIEAKVTNRKQDGKLDLTIRQRAYLQMDADAEKILARIEDCHGELPFNDKASPEVIKREFQMSKNAFKRAVGRLYKERRIDITERSIRKL